MRNYFYDYYNEKLLLWLLQWEITSMTLLQWEITSMTITMRNYFYEIES
jgi:hypothetical protein